MTTNILRIAGFDQLTITGSSTASWGTLRLQVALVLDNTGSMNDAGKLSALKTASHQLLTQLQNAAKNPGDVQVAIIPFNTDVNVGTTNVNATWLKWSYSTSPSGTSSSSSSTCIAGWCWNGSTWVNGGTVTTSKTGWSGCVIDRDQSYDVQNTTPDAGTAATLFPADNPLLGCPAQMMGLGYNWAAMSTLIDSMVANGETNQTIGLAWGWEALTNGTPLNAPAASGTQRSIILLTDGLNTADRWYNILLGVGGGTQANIDARTQLACTNIKAAGITLYTIQVNTGGDPTSTMLQQCASSPSKFFLLRTAGEIVTTFNQLGTNLTQLHIAR